MNQIKHKILAPIVGFAYMRTLLLAILFVGAFSYLGFSSYARAAATTPATINYQGRLLNSANVPLAGNYTFRFSLWNSADWQASDTTGAGAVDITSPRYAGWQETHALTTATFGLFNISLGSNVALPNFDANIHKFLQVEVKVTGALDTTYEILDPQGNTGDLVDRKTLHDQAYAENADTIDNAEIGTGAGNLAVLGAGGVWDIARIPGGTNANSFILDYDNTGGVSSLQFGNDGTDGAISFNNDTGDITFTTPGSNNFTFDNGTLTATSDAGLDFANADQFRIRESANPNLLAACSALGELIFDTGANKLMYCTVVGTPGTWANVDTAGAVDDFETVYSADADKTLSTANNNMTIDTGTSNFIVSGANFSVNGAGDITTTGTINGVNLSSIPFGNMATRVKEAVYTPGFAGGTSYPDGTANQGTLQLKFEDLGGAGKRNFYDWTTQQVLMQDMDVVASLQLPLDFDSFTGSPMSVTYQTSDGVIATNRVDVSLYDTTGADVALTGGSALANAGWTTAAITFGGAPTFTAGDTITIRIKLSSTNAGFARRSDLVLNYNGL